MSEKFERFEELEKFEESEKFWCVRKIGFSATESEENLKRELIIEEEKIGKKFESKSRS